MCSRCCRHRLEAAGLHRPIQRSGVLQASQFAGLRQSQVVIVWHHVLHAPPTSTIRRKTFRRKRRRDAGPWHMQHHAERAEKLPSCGTSSIHGRAKQSGAVEGRHYYKHRRPRSARRRTIYALEPPNSYRVRVACPAPSPRVRGHISASCHWPCYHGQRHLYSGSTLPALIASGHSVCTIPSTMRRPTRKKSTAMAVD